MRADAHLNWFVYPLCHLGHEKKQRDILDNGGLKTCRLCIELHILPKVTETFILYVLDKNDLQYLFIYVATCILLIKVFWSASGSVVVSK